MKQTAVEFLASKLNPYGLSESQTLVFEQAKEIEKQQQGYSEEEIKSAFKIGFNIGYGSPVQELDLKNEHCEKWFNKFKNK
jgi:hypothetical protein